LNQPNIILLTIDTLRADRLGCYGYPQDITPNLDRLAASGVRFEQAISGGSWTQAAFPVILTSTYASMYGGCMGPLSLERPSPVEMLAQHGYTTAAFANSPLLSRVYGYQRGFDHFMELAPDETDPSLRHIKGGQSLLRNPLVHYVSNLVGKRLRPARLYVSAAKVNQDLFDWMDKVHGPFFVWAHYMDVHWPYHLEEDLTSPQEIAQAWRDISHLHRVNWEGESIAPAQKNHYMTLYDRAVQYTDEQIGRLLDHLENSGHAENTIIIIVSDHGEEFLEREHWGHVETNLHDEIIKIPLIIRVPGQNEGQVIQRQVRTLDIMPTILSLCNCPLPAGMEGNSLEPLWDENVAEYGDRIAISERWRDEGDISHIIALRTESFKYIWNDREPDQAVLYDLQNDPEEKHDVRSLYPEKAGQFQSVIDQHRVRVAKTKPTNSVSKPELDKAITERLRGLGYLE
jgi:arylsulfatase A-like enzyme